MRRTKEDAELTRQHLLQAGLKVFSDKGYTETRLSDVAEEAGTTRGAIYWHFKNKKELFIALFQESVNPFVDEIAKILEKDRTPLQQLRMLMSQILNKIEKSAEFRANQALELVNRKTQQEMPELREYIINRTEKFVDKIKKIIISGQKDGKIRKDITAEAIINVFITLFRGYAFLMTHDILMPIFKMDTSEQIVEIFIKGIKT